MALSVVCINSTIIVFLMSVELIGSETTLLVFFGSWIFSYISEVCLMGDRYFSHELTCFMVEYSLMKGFIHWFFFMHSHSLKKRKTVDHRPS